MNTYLSDQNNPLVSVVVRTKDRPELLRRALSSIYRSTYRPISVVLVNDGGKPIEPKTLSELLLDIKYKLIHHEENKGRAKSLNTGIKESEGELICFLDDDDILMPEGISKLVKASIENPYSVVYGNVVCRRYTSNGLQFIDEWLIDSEFDKERLLLENIIPLNALCIPKRLLNSIGDIDTEFPIYEDWDMLIRLSEIANFVHVNEIVAEYSIFVEATIIGKGGEAYQRYYREKILRKYIHKITPEIILKFIFEAPHIRAKDHLITHLQTITYRDSKEIASLRSQIEQLQHAIEEKNKKLQYLQKELSDLLNSKSWRLTKPFRKIRSLFRKPRTVYDLKSKTPVDIEIDEIIHEEALPKVEVIIVNYNGLRYIDQCISSLLKTEYPCFSVTLVDNCSTDGSVQLIEERYPTVKLIKNDRNLGFGAANDLAISSTDAEFIALLNNDTVVDPKWLKPLVSALISDNTIAAVSSKLLFLDNPKVINYAGGGMSFTGFGYDIGVYQPDSDIFSKPSECLFPSGAACVMRKDAYSKVGGFDSRFFMYHEDVDLGWRFWLYGYRVLCIPKSVVYHAFGGTSKEVGGSDFKADYGLRHAIRSLIKNYQLRYLTTSLIYMTLLSFKKLILYGNTSILKAISWNLRNLFDTLKHRRVIQKERSISDEFLLKKGLIYSGIHPQVYTPDYYIINLKTFKESSNRRNSIHLGINDHGNLGFGWYSTEHIYNGQKTRFRYTMSEAVVYLFAQGENSIIIEMAVPGYSMRSLKAMTLSINGESFKMEELSEDFREYRFSINKQFGVVEIGITVVPPFIPHEYYYNKDYRHIGVAIRKIELVKNTKEEVFYDGISVIIPTYNRAEELKKTLIGLSEQSLDREKYEVILVDDGSTDHTSEMVKDFIKSSPIKISYHFQQNKKQGAARNHGLKYAKNPIVLFIGDDTVPEKDCLKEHLITHQEKNNDGKLAVLGFTDWPEHFKITPFMDYVSGYGHQFGYKLIQDGDILDFTLFYTSNISLSKDMLTNQAYVFDEDFKTYGWEDIDLGYRLQQQGLTILYNKKAKTRHYHRMDINYFCKRQLMVGKGAKVMYCKHPELKNMLKLDRVKYFKRLYMFAVIFKYVISLFDRLSIPLPHRLYSFVLNCYYGVGYDSKN